MSIRTLHVNGIKFPDTEYSVSIANHVVEYNDNELFSFTTDVKMHGSLCVQINVQHGSIIMQGCTVTYPAIINNIDGYVTIDQPITSPVTILENNKLITMPYDIKIKSGETFKYYHLMANGPSLFNIEINENLTNSKLYLGNLSNIKLLNKIKKINKIYNYKHKQLNFQNPKHLEHLKLLAENQVPN
jgi:hypothetical protein